MDWKTEPPSPGQSPPNTPDWPSHHLSCKVLGCREGNFQDDPLQRVAVNVDEQLQKNKETMHFRISMFINIR